MERVERMHWRLLVEMAWDPMLGEVAGASIPARLSGQERIDYYKARAFAQRTLQALFPEDEPDGIA